MPIIIASGPVIVEDGKVLVNKHGDTSFWKFCGGRVENFDLGLQDNAAREAKEEMGIDIEVLDQEPFITFATKTTDDSKIFDVILVHYLAKRIGEVTPGEDIREWNWLDVNNLPEDLGPNIIPALKHFGFIK
ncbi:MAG: NUDIX domain-containing protein [Patescibacteria group bacterium]|nr:NUDIX domain-containing protein [Patescibacteria group bacterium]